MSSEGGELRSALVVTVGDSVKKDVSGVEVAKSVLSGGYVVAVSMRVVYDASGVTVESVYVYEGAPSTVSTMVRVGDGTVDVSTVVLTSTSVAVEAGVGKRTVVVGTGLPCGRGSRSAGTVQRPGTGVTHTTERDRHEAG